MWFYYVYNEDMREKRWVFATTLFAIVGIAFSFLAFVWLRNEIHKEQQASFNQETSNIVTSITSRLDEYAALLYSGKGFFESQQPVNKEEWDTYASALGLNHNYPGIPSFGFAQQVSPPQKQAFIAQMKKVYPNFIITPSGNREEYVVLTYLTPKSAENDRSIGADILANSVKKLTIDETAQTGQPTISSKVTLVGDLNSEPAFILRLAVYKPGLPLNTPEQRQKAVIGYVSAAVKMSGFIQSVLTHNFQGVRFAIYDGKNTSGLTSSSLYYNNLPKNISISRRLTSIKVLPILSGAWTFVFWDTSKISLRDRFASIIVLSVGIILTFISTTLLYLLLTGKKRAEAIAERMTKELSRAVEKLRGDKKTLEEAMTKDEFLSMAAHQLRTPLGEMRWRLETLFEKDKLPKDIKGEMNKLYDSVLRLVRLVNDLLDFSRMAQNRLNDTPKDLDFAALVSGLIHEMKPEIKQKKLEINFEQVGSLNPVYFDEVLLREAMQNLMSNAIKYNRIGGNITIHAKKAKNQLEISIKDTGIGIPPNDIPTIFEKFKRGSNASGDQYEGSGLGLFVVKSYIERWHGKIKIESKLNKGTKISLEIPFEKR